MYTFLASQTKERIQKRKEKLNFQMLPVFLVNLLFFQSCLQHPNNTICPLIPYVRASLVSVGSEDIIDSTASVPALFNLVFQH